MEELQVWMMTRKEVMKALSISSATLHRGMADGRFPKPYRTGEHSVRWRSIEIQDCINQFQVAEPVQVAPGSKRGRKPKQLGGALYELQSC
jgi:predicted DNA-binding transcriptional regulator AlpA